MEMYLTRQHNGLYMLTALKPILSRVEGGDFEDAYVAPGEPVGMRNFCDIILRLVGIEKPLKRGETVKILLSGSLIT
jgi:hypothetical protein